MLKFAESNLYQCLENIPETIVKSNRNTAFCGNFFVEEGKMMRAPLKYHRCPHQCYDNLIL